MLKLLFYGHFMAIVVAVCLLLFCFCQVLIIIFRFTLLARSTSVTGKEIDDLVVENNISKNYARKGC